MSDIKLQLAAAFAAGAAAAAGLALLLQRPTTRKAVFVNKLHPNWTPPQKQLPPHDPDKMHIVDPSVMEKAAVYPLVISTVVPRPVGEQQLSWRAL